MARQHSETACILREIYNAEFHSEDSEQYRISWDQLRGIAGVAKLAEDDLRDIGEEMITSGYALIPFDDFLLVTMEADFRHARKLPARLSERYLFSGGEEDEVDGDDDVELDGDDSAGEL